MDSYLVVGAEYGLRPRGTTPFNVPENLWTALTFARGCRIALTQQEEDLKAGRVRIVNEDAEEAEG